jgi:hypothetical protein
MHDNLEVYVGAASSNAIVAAPFPVKVHKIVLQHADGAAVLAVAVFDAATATGTAKAGLTTNLADGTTFQRYAEANFDPPLRFGTGVSTTLTGTGTYRIYYSK